MRFSVLIHLCLVASCLPEEEADGDLFEVDAGAPSPDAASSPLPEGHELELTELLPGTACADLSEANRVDFSFQFMSLGSDGLNPVGPTDWAPGQPETYADQVRAAGLTFELPLSAVGLDSQEVDAVIDVDAPQGFTGAVTGRQIGTALDVADVRYDFAGGLERATAPRLIVMLLDHSGSLRGQDDPTLAPNPAKASDLESEHLGLFRQLLGTSRLPEDTWFSLLWFHGSHVFVTPEFATPTQDRTVFACPEGDVICAEDSARDGLARVATGQAGGTPLVDALGAAYAGVIQDALQRGLNPVVVLFTDGVENGDTSTTRDALPGILGKYLDSKVPITVLHLPPAASSADVRGPDAALNGLACATGGQYVFVARPEHFRERDVRSRLVASLFGAWHADVSMAPESRLPRGPALLSTVFRAEVGATALFTSLAAPAVPGAPDTRAFVTPWR